MFEVESSLDSEQRLMRPQQNGKHPQTQNAGSKTWDHDTDNLFFFFFLLLAAFFKPINAQS